MPEGSVTVNPLPVELTLPGVEDLREAEKAIEAYSVTIRLPDILRHKHATA
jgi:hypothetical protein